MNYYEIWFDLAPGEQDMVVVKAVQNWLDYLKSEGTLVSYQIKRRKFGFSPEWGREFHVSIAFNNLAQLDDAFNVAATRKEPIESLHKEVYSRITRYAAALYRDFPDEIRKY